MGNYKQIRSLISGFAGQGNTITIPKIFIELTGDYSTATLLNQIIFWSDKTTRKDGLFYKTYNEWEEETMLTEYQIRRSVGKLKNLGFIDTELKRANGSPTVHYRFHNEVLSDSILNKLKYDTEETQESDTEETKESDTKETKETITVDYTVDNTVDNTVKKAKPCFKTFYKAYPKKRGRGQALITFEKKVKDQPTLDLILKDLEKRKNFKDWLNDDGQWIPYPSTYLNDEGWLDEYETNENTSRYDVPIL